MKQIPPDLVSALLLACVVAAALVPREAPGAGPAAPPSRTVDSKDVLHGVTVPDPYR